MPAPQTLLALAGAATSPGNLGDSVLVLIDCQNEYVTGKLPLAGVSSALDQIAALLARARAAKTPIVHVVHKGRPGGLFDLAAESGRIAGRAAAAIISLIESGRSYTLSGLTARRLARNFATSLETMVMA